MSPSVMVSPLEFVRVTLRLIELTAEEPMMVVPAVRLVPHDKEDALAETSTTIVLTKTKKTKRKSFIVPELLCIS